MSIQSFSKQLALVATLLVSTFIAAQAPAQVDTVATGERRWNKTHGRFYFDNYLSLQTNIIITWSTARADPDGSGAIWLQAYSDNTEMTLASGASDIRQIEDASALAFSPELAEPLEEGEIVVFRNTATGYYGAFRFNDYYSEDIVDITWYLQEDRGPDFSIHPPYALNGCLSLEGAPVTRRKVFLDQPEQPRQTRITDPRGCVLFPDAARGERIKLRVIGKLLQPDATIKSGSIESWPSMELQNLTDGFAATYAVPQTQSGETVLTFCSLCGLNPIAAAPGATALEEITDAASLLENAGGLTDPVVPGDFLVMQSEDPPMIYAALRVDEITTEPSATVPAMISATWHLQQNGSPSFAPRDYYALSSCFEVGGVPKSGKKVVLKQDDTPNQVTYTGSDGCFDFDTVLTGRRYTLIINAGKLR